MPELTHQEYLDADAEIRFARWIVNLGGWCHADTLTAVPDAQVSANWLADERLRRDHDDRIVELTGFGREWCRQQGID